MIANSGTGRYLVNNEVLFTTLDALAQGAEDWHQVGKRLGGVLPQRFAEVVGPWHFGQFFRDQMALRNKGMSVPASGRDSVHILPAVTIDLTR